MKRLSIFALLLLSILLSGGCSEQSSEQEQSSAQPTPSISDSEPIAEPTVTSSVELPPFKPMEDEICLTVMCSSFFVPSAEELSPLNWYLRENGYGFYVEAFGTSIREDETAVLRSYEDFLEARDEGTKVDLAMLFVSEEEMIQAIEQGLLLRLSPFLEQEGQESWVSKVPQNYWESVRVGMGEKRDIYGLYSSASIVSGTVIAVNEELFSAAGVELPEELSLGDLPTLLGKLSESGALENSEICAPLLSTAMCWPSVWKLAGEYTQLEQVMLEKKGDTFEVVNIFGSQKLLNAAQILYDLYQNEQLEYIALETMETYVAKKKFAAAVLSNTWEMDQFSQNSIYRQDGIRIYPQTTAVRAETHMLGIASWSTHPQEAYTLLSLLYSNEDVANLLYYGTLSADVEAGSRVSPTSGFRGMANQIFLNHLLTDSEKKEYVEMMEELPVIPIFYNELIVNGEISNSDWYGSEERLCFSVSVEDIFDECKTKEDLTAYLKNCCEFLEKSEIFSQAAESWIQQLALAQD